MVKGLTWSSLAGLVLMFLGAGRGRLDAETLFPDFDLRVECPERIAGEPSETLRFDAKVVLRSTLAGADGRAGVRAWSLGLHAGRNARIVGASTQNTVGAAAPDGLRENDGYENTELTRGRDNEGAVSAVILSFTMDVFLPVEGEASLLNLKLEAPVPDAHETEYVVDFIDGLVGSGEPVKNTITYGAGFTRRDDGGEMDNDTDRYEPCVVLVLPARSFVRGNTREDSVVNLTDGVVLLDHLFHSGAAPPCLESADTNDDGNVNLADVVYLLNHLFRAGPSIPAPYPDCGKDPTDDELGCATPHCP